MGAWNVKDREHKNCDNPAILTVCVSTITADGKDEVVGGVVFVSQTLGGVPRPVGKSPYANGCEKFNADLNCPLTLQPVAAPGFKCVIGRKASFKMGKVNVEKAFTFKCLTC